MKFAFSVVVLAAVAVSVQCGNSKEANAYCSNLNAGSKATYLGWASQTNGDAAKCEKKYKSRPHCKSGGCGLYYLVEYVYNRYTSSNCYACPKKSPLRWNIIKDVNFAGGDVNNSQWGRRNFKSVNECYDYCKKYSSQGADTWQRHRNGDCWCKVLAKTRRTSQPNSGIQSGIYPVSVTYMDEDRK